MRSQILTFIYFGIGSLIRRITASDYCVVPAWFDNLHLISSALYYRSSNYATINIQPAIWLSRSAPNS